MRRSSLPVAFLIAFASTALAQFAITPYPRASHRIAFGS